MKNNNTSAILITGGENKIINTGASGAIPRKDMKRMNNHAKLYYDEIRNRTSDIEAISKNSGFPKNDIEKIKNHVFFNEYNLSEEAPTRFEPDYDMAVSWQRLVEGNDIREMDIILLNHELMEHELMTEKGLSYREAHEETEKKYNYSKHVKELNRKEGLQ